MTNKIFVRPFKAGEEEIVVEIDELSGNDVQQWNDALEDGSNDYSWGIFDGNTCMGYCTIGYADDMCGVIEDYPLYQEYSKKGEDCYYISDVFIKPEFRRNGYGLKLIQETIQGRFQKECPAPVFIEAVSQETQQFYAKVGFQPIDELAMVLPLQKKKEKFVVVFTDGYKFKNEYFDSYEDASDFMEKEYSEIKEQAEKANNSISEDSFIDIAEAKLEIVGMDIFLWQILGF